MSTNIYWRPVTPNEHKSLPKALKYVLGPRYWGHDGTVGGDDKTIGLEELPYLEGLRDAKVDGAQELIDLIEKHGAVVVWLEG